MSLFLHLLIHILLGFVAGIITWLITKRFWASIIPAVLAGVLIDLDHFIEYCLVFGWSFNFGHFIEGFEYLESAKMRVVFHGWEYVIILVAAYFLLKSGLAKTIALAIALGLFLHMGADSLINGIPPKSYSIIYRAVNNFDMEKLVTPEHWEGFKIERGDYLNKYTK